MAVGFLLSVSCVFYFAPDFLLFLSVFPLFVGSFFSPFFFDMYLVGRSSINMIRVWPSLVFPFAHVVDWRERSSFFFVYTPERWRKKLGDWSSRDSAGRGGAEESWWFL